MTEEELNKSNLEKTKNRFKSRTFWLTVLWTAFIPIAIVVQIFLKEMELPITSLVTLAGSITLMYIGGNKAGNIVSTMQIEKVKKSEK